MASQHVLCWHVAATMLEELVSTDLRRAFWSQPPTPDLLVHSDLGGQYCGNDHRKLLRDR
ncbi:hypothetical protein GKZ68_20890 (plasmid) [Hymenobacter sp. BRD128]|uniref:hypothetical protein n=1 Tax=Hymenobacter sp. BRD128 TaxID=2675878 RepID=UPI001562F9F0|nr:hypothetical protein [Hymenobacter sp. BRD128]QKG59140.1 hypothetical protein GKZ68_20890 [Hymenobacter sp. BRD128]